ncbi:MAG: Clp protease N-terminal domain-containing protein [Dermatophilaceae bacterium]
MFERFTAEARSTVLHAQEHAARRKDSSITPTHLLLALSDGNLSSLLTRYGINTEQIERYAPGHHARAVDDDTALRSIGVDLHAIREAVESAFGPGALETAPRPRRRWPTRTPGTNSGHKAFNGNAKKALELSLRETIRLDAREISAESILLGLLRTGDPELATVFEHSATNQTDLRIELESHVRKAA